MHEYQVKILKFLKDSKSATPEELQKSVELGSDAIRWAIETLAENGAVKVVKKARTTVMLTAEGKQYKESMPEELFIRWLLKNGQCNISAVENRIGLIWAKRNGWIHIENGIVKLTNSGELAAKKEEYKLRSVLTFLDEQEYIPESYLSAHKQDIETLKKRNLISLSEKSMFETVSITEKGIRIFEEGIKEEGVNQLTKEMLLSGSWKNSRFKKYDINAPVEAIYAARPHPVREFINYIRSLWISMGFTEVSGPIIESAFWDFDALFSPQDHPTREMQDTFFLSNPKQIGIEDLALLNRVKKMHTSNWGEVWRSELAEQALLRTHTTSISAHYIYKISKALQSEYPVKLFSVGKVFRNESIDYKHLAELTQYDGIIIGDRLNFANLIDTLRRFYDSMGFDTNPRNKKFKFKPAYFPFVEPGVEALYYNEEKHDWIELVGGGIIRREITNALGTKKTVLAWGGGVERLMFHFMNLDSLVTLYKNEIQWLRERDVLKV
ncbi:MAG: phenylalanine--tRNA ligase subunit alpha [Candidatus Micrarchaeaceae archaeon]